MSISIGWKILQDIAKMLGDRGIPKEALNFEDMRIHGELGFFVMSMRPLGSTAPWYHGRASEMSEEVLERVKIKGIPISHYFNNVCIEIRDSGFNPILIEMGEGSDLHAVSVTLNNDLCHDQDGKPIEISLFSIAHALLSDPNCLDKVADAVILIIERIEHIREADKWRRELVGQINNLNKSIRALDLKAINFILYGEPDTSATGAAGVS